MREKISKYLTEKMGLCWHKYRPIGFGKYGCWDCGYENKDKKQKNLLSPEGFFILWNWAIKQDWWMDFEKQQVSIAGIKNKNSYLECMISIHAILGDIINYETFPIKIYNYLKESE